MFVQLLNNSIIECNQSITRLLSPVFNWFNNTNNQMAFENMVIWILDQNTNGFTSRDHLHDFIPFKFQTKHSGWNRILGSSIGTVFGSLGEEGIASQVHFKEVKYLLWFTKPSFSLNRTWRSCPGKFWDCSDNGPKPLPEINLKPNFQLVF